MAVAQTKKVIQLPEEPRVAAFEVIPTARIDSPARALQDRLQTVFEQDEPEKDVDHTPAVVRMSGIFYLGLLAWGVVIAAVAIAWTAFGS